VEVPDFEGMAAGWPALCVPVIARMHGSASYFTAEMGSRPKPLTWFLERASLQRANFCCSCSRYTADRTKRLLRLQRSEIVILHNPVRISATQSQSFRVSDQVVFSGTLTPKKGVISLIRAWSMVLEKYPSAELHLFGKDGRTNNGGSLRDYLLSCAPSQVRDTVHFHGHVTLARLRTAYQSAMVAVFPSYSEAFALAPMEAMAEACPTIYTRRASGSELIDDEVNGLLVDPDDPRNIADAITRILKSANVAEALGSAGKKCVERDFSLETLLPQNVNFYLECIRSFGQEAANN
jgi:glycosyltransferase involved in cell wall biosynthesis